MAREMYGLLHSLSSVGRLLLMGACFFCGVTMRPSSVCIPCGTSITMMPKGSLKSSDTVILISEGECHTAVCAGMRLFSLM